MKETGDHLEGTTKIVGRGHSLIPYQQEEGTLQQRDLSLDTWFLLGSFELAGNLYEPQSELQGSPRGHGKISESLGESPCRSQMSQVDHKLKYDGLVVLEARYPSPVGWKTKRTTFVPSGVTAKHLSLV